MRPASAVANAASGLAVAWQTSRARTEPLVQSYALAHIWGARAEKFAARWQQSSLPKLCNQCALGEQNVNKAALHWRNVFHLLPRRPKNCKHSSTMFPKQSEAHLTPPKYGATFGRCQSNKWAVRVRTIAHCATHIRHRHTQIKSACPIVV